MHGGKSPGMQKSRGQVAEGAVSAVCATPALPWPVGTPPSQPRKNKETHPFLNFLFWNRTPLVCRLPLFFPIQQDRKQDRKQDMGRGFSKWQVTNRDIELLGMRKDGVHGALEVWCGKGTPCGRCIHHNPGRTGSPAISVASRVHSWGMQRPEMFCLLVSHSSRVRGYRKRR